ncbi:hypothetical protein GALL_143470 [mine drainage metagenome]|uniref:Lipoprotein n=1 Tax=mine drainage metagenome TaxID=410659 RepID=A0A1J5SHH3_9ZZZZ
MRLFLMAAMALALAGCGERDKAMVYKQGVYQGKTDSAPWNNALYKGDKAKWESDIRARNQQQDESRRIGG